MFVCTVVDCCSLDDPVNGQVELSNTTFGSMANYTCNQRYFLSNGNSTRTCEANGEWSGSPPSCEREWTYHKVKSVCKWLPWEQNNRHVELAEITLCNIWSCYKNRNCFGISSHLFSVMWWNFYHAHLLRSCWNMTSSLIQVWNAKDSFLNCNQNHVFPKLGNISWLWKSFCTTPSELWAKILLCIMHFSQN